MYLTGKDESFLIIKFDEIIHEILSRLL